MMHQRTLVRRGLQPPSWCLPGASPWCFPGASPGPPTAAARASLGLDVPYLAAGPMNLDQLALNEGPDRVM
jgi:hypothetical protein